MNLFVQARLEFGDSKILLIPNGWTIAMTLQLKCDVDFVGGVERALIV